MKIRFVCKYFGWSLIKYAVAISIGIFCSRVAYIFLNNENKIISLIFSFINQKYIPYIIPIILCGIVYCSIHRANKDKIINQNGCFYIDIPYQILYLLSFVTGYKSIETVNVPIWMQFLIYKSPYWNISTGNQLDSKKDSVSIIESNHKVNDDEINVILEDTYRIIDKIPDRLKKIHKNLIVSRSMEYEGNASLNEEFVDKSVAKLNRFYKSEYTVINIFASTNPVHTKKIVDGVFKKNIREKHVTVNVYQSVGMNHIYSEKHKVIK